MQRDVSQDSNPDAESACQDWNPDPQHEKAWHNLTERPWQSRPASGKIEGSDTKGERSP
jgi:hypothetical protein